MTRHMGRIVWGWLIMALALLPLFFPGTASAAVSARMVNEGGKELVVIANDSLELTFEPGLGGRCIRFVFKDDGEQIIGGAEVSGMFLDHWAKYPWPSGLMWLPYDAKIVGDGTTRVGVQLQLTVPAKGGGKGSPSRDGSLETPTSPDLIGLVVSKTVWLSADNDVIVVDQEIKNPTAESRAVAPYIQHNLNLGGRRYMNSWYLSSGQGVVVNLQPDAEGGTSIGPDWVLDPTSGWMAVRDRATDRGLLFAFDYDEYYYVGDKAEHESRYNPFATKGQALPGARHRNRLRPDRASGADSALREMGYRLGGRTGSPFQCAGDCRCGCRHSDLCPRLPALPFRRRATDGGAGRDARSSHRQGHRYGAAVSLL